MKVSTDCRELLEKSVVFDSFKFKHSGLLWANCINEFKENAIFVNVINVTDDDISLKKDDEVGEIFELLDDEVPIIDEKKSNTNWIDKIKINDKIDAETRTKLINLCTKYDYVFHHNDADFGRINLAEHRIDIGTERPIRQKQYRLPQIAEDEVEKQINSMLENDIIKESKSPWCSPIIIVKKKSEDGKPQFRFCIDFRNVNFATVKDSYPLPRIDETIDALGGATFFTTLDLASGYWQIPVADQDKEKTAFCANNQLFEFNVMPFGLCNAPSTFQRLMDGILRNLNWKYCLVYLDDVIVFSNDIDTHFERLELIFQKFS